MNGSTPHTRIHAPRPRKTKTTSYPTALTFLAVLSASCADEPSSFSLGDHNHALSQDPPLVVSEVYGGGGNTSATLTHDFIELFNRSAEPILLSEYSLQYTSASGVTLLGATPGLITELPPLVLGPGQFFLIQEAQGNAGTSALPTPDLIDPTPISMSATSGKLALVRGVTPLGCNGSPTACAPEALVRIVDLVGIGGSTFFEGNAPAPAPTNTTSVARTAPCLDGNQNVSDFAVSSPSPQNSASPQLTCASQTDAGAADAGPSGDGGLDAGPGIITRIRDIQGRAHRSPLVDQNVANVAGIVTVVRPTGFYFQDPEPDADAATSEALFVFTGQTPSVAVGDFVRVDGRVSEFRPGCYPSCAPSNSAFSGLTTTQIDRPTRVVTIARNLTLPAAVRLGAQGRPMPDKTIDDDTSGPDVEQGPTTFDPESDGLDYFESLEGMLVHVHDAVATSPTRRFGTSSRELSVLADNGKNAGLRSEGGGIIIAADDFNPERILLSNALVADLPLVHVGARFPGVIEGVVDYSFGNFKLLFSTPLPTVVPSTLQRETTSLSPANASELSIANFNVENLSALDDAGKLETLADLIVHNLAAPDVLAVEEAQDNNGPINDAVVDASETYRALAAAITRAGGPVYDFRDIAPIDDQDGGQPGGNIRVGFMFRTDRGLTFVDRGQADAETANAVIGRRGSAHLAYSPGRIDPKNPAFLNSRKPLAAEFRFAGKTLFLIANHFNSKGGDQPLFGRFQPPVLASAAQRFEQAQVVAAFIREIRAVDSAALIMVLGDLNDFEFADTLEPLREVGMTSLVDTLPPEERYSYVFDGNSQVLDHIMVSESLLPRTLGFDIVHVSSEFYDQVSDHDPSIARITMSRRVRRIPPWFHLPILGCR